MDFGCDLHCSVRGVHAMDNHDLHECTYFQMGVTNNQEQLLRFNSKFRLVEDLRKSLNVSMDSIIDRLM